MHAQGLNFSGTLRKFASMLHAMARASSVLPVPGGPYSSTPEWQVGREGGWMVGGEARW
jgi:hypothetical protein